jgi:hypothetical protein
MIFICANTGLLFFYRRDSFVVYRNDFFGGQLMTEWTIKVASEVQELWKDWPIEPPKSVGIFVHIEDGFRWIKRLSGLEDLNPRRPFIELESKRRRKEGLCLNKWESFPPSFSRVRRVIIALTIIFHTFSGQFVLLQDMPMMMLRRPVDVIAFDNDNAMQVDIETIV